MAMSTPNPAPTGPPPPPPTRPAPAPPHVPLIDRVTALENHVAKLSELHNQFTDDVTAELGL